MEKYKIIFTEPFEIELENIISYIHYQFNEPIIADKKLEQIINNVYTLDIFPDRCPMFTDNEHNFRKLIVDKYIIIYKVFEDTRMCDITTYISF